MASRDWIWLVGEPYRGRRLRRYLIANQRQHAGSLWRIPLRIPCYGHGASGSLADFGSSAPEKDLTIAAEVIDPESLEVGGMCVTPGGLFLMTAKGESPPGWIGITYPVKVDSVVDLIASPPAAPGEPLASAELTLRDEARRGYRPRRGSKLAWKLKGADAGAALTFGFALQQLSIALVREDAVRLSKGVPCGAEFSVGLIASDGAERQLWSEVIDETAAGAVIESPKVMLPSDTEGWTLVFSVKAAPEASDDAKVYPVWLEPSIRKRRPDDDRPNVIILLLDTLRADRLGAYGYPRGTTPHLDALAKKGVRFEDAWSSAPWTLPSHASLFSSLYMSEHGVWDPSQSLSTDAVTIAELLSDAGYKTGAFTESG